MYQADEERFEAQRLMGHIQLQERERTKLRQDLSQVCTPLTGRKVWRGVRGREIIRVEVERKDIYDRK